MKRFFFLPDVLRWMGLMLILLSYGGSQAEMLDPRPQASSKSDVDGTQVAVRKARAEREHRFRNDLRMALVNLRARKFDDAQRLFETYIDHLPQKEQQFYRDISLVAGKGDQARYKDMPEDQKEKMIRRLWNRYDPAPLTRANERLLEHYRRVTDARRYFSLDAFPWDDRGEVYIRFGLPDHVSRSGNVRVEKDPSILKARRKFAALFFPYSDVQPGYPTFPVEEDVRWEYWVYTDLDGGIEFTFVDEYSTGRYIFAPIPMAGAFQDIEFLEASGGHLLQHIVASQPAVYKPEFADLPIDFSIHTVGFKGSGGNSHLEIYSGLLASETAHLQADERTGLIGLERGVALYDSLWNEVYRVQDQIALRLPTEQEVLKRAFIPGVMQVDLPPGPYYMSFQVRDALSGKSLVYQQEIVLEDYSDTKDVHLSDIEFAFSVSPAHSSGAFVKNGLKVIPISSRTLRRDQHAFVYFEVYNLSRDEFGRTHYRVEHTLQAHRKRSAPGRFFRGLGRVFHLTEPEPKLVIAYDQEGDRPDEEAYVELDLTHTDPGDQLIQVAVTDLLTGQKVSKEVTFKMMP